MIEIGTLNDEFVICVNYYLKYSSLPIKKIMNNNNFIYFLSSISYYFEIQKVYLYTDYSACDLLGNSTQKYKGNYCIDFYKYIKYEKKRFRKLSTFEIKPIFSYFQLDKMKSTTIDFIFTNIKKDELIYQVYKKFKEIYENKKFVNDFYIYIIENYCFLIKKLIEILSTTIYVIDNPFIYDYYEINCNAYLYKKKIVPTFKSYSDNLQNLSEYFPKNKYRIDNTSLVRNMESY